MFFKKKQPKTHWSLVSKGVCSCGGKLFAPLRADDSCHCTNCGAMYLIGRYQVKTPMAAWEEVEAT